MDQRLPQGTPSCSLIPQIANYETLHLPSYWLGPRKEKGLEKAVCLLPPSHFPQLLD